MMLQPNCAECPIGECPQVSGLGTRTEGTKLFAVRGEDVQFDLIGVAIAPAYEEMQRKMPMVGPSGQFLRKTLSQLNINEYYITNCLLCPIPSGASDAEISRAQACCGARLESEILAHKPKLILAMGDMPFHQLCNNDFPITEHQGRPFITYLNVPLIPVAHPAFYLRRADDAYDFIEVTRTAVRYLSNNYHLAGDVERVVVTEENVDAILKILWTYDTLTVDTETSGLHLMGLKPDILMEVGISYDEKRCFVIPVVDTSTYAIDGQLRPLPNLLSRFKELLETKNIDGWNLFFDWRAIRTHGINMQRLRFDGMLGHYCLDERQYSHGLKKVARVYIGAENWEAENKQYLPNKEASFALIPTDVRQDYLSKDVCYTNQMNAFLEPEVKDNWVFHNILMPATKVFSETLYKGVPISPYKVLELNALLRQDIDRDERELWDMAGRVFNPASPKDVAEIIYDDLRIPIDPKYGRSTNKKLFEQIKDDYEILSRIFDHREMVHDLDQYVVGFAKRIDNNYRVHPSIKLFGTVTGRISSEDPSIMNIKRDSSIKEVFVASEGKLLAEFDLKGAELRWYCIYSDDQVLKDILINGFKGDLGFPLTDDQRKDPHYMIGAIAYGQERADALRAPAKMTVFGKLYLRGLASIERQYGKETGQRLSALVDEFVPNHKAYTKQTREEMHGQGYVQSFFGRQRRFPIINRENAREYERMAVNMKIQSASSDLNLLNLIFAYDHRREFNIWPMFTVHDSIMVEIPDESVIGPLHKALEENANRITHTPGFFQYDVKVGPSWGEAKKWKEQANATNNN